MDFKEFLHQNKLNFNSTFINFLMNPHMCEYLCVCVCVYAVPCAEYLVEKAQEFLEPPCFL